MSLYGEYIKEREGFEIIESDRGFASYRISGLECYIRDIYVAPLHRNTHLASEMTNEITDIARSKGCTYLSGTVCPNVNNPTSSMKALLAYGFKLAISTPDLIWFKKDI